MDSKVIKVNIMVDEIYLNPRAYIWRIPKVPEQYELGVKPVTVAEAAQVPIEWEDWRIRTVQFGKLTKRYLVRVDQEGLWLELFGLAKRDVNAILMDGLRTGQMQEYNRIRALPWLKRLFRRF